MAAAALASLRLRLPAPARPASTCGAQQRPPAACSRPAQRRQRAPAPPAAAAAEGPEEPELAEEPEEQEGEETVHQLIQRIVLEDEEADRAAGRRKVLKVTKQRGLEAWQPGVAPADVASDAPPATYEQLLQQLPGLQRQLRRDAQERAGLPSGDYVPDEAFQELGRYPRKPEPQLGEWDLRARMEKKRRQEREAAAWHERRAAAGRYPSLGADWRTDARITSTGDPREPEYREWSHAEIWELITNAGRNADPRDVEMFVRNPQEIADAPSQGAAYAMTPEEWFEAEGRLIKEDDLAAIAASAGDKEGDAAALLAAEFDDFDEQLVGYDGGGFGGGAAPAAGGDEDDGF